jgi:hypothetical protein
VRSRRNSKPSKRQRPRKHQHNKRRREPKTRKPLKCFNVPSPQQHQIHQQQLHLHLHLPCNHITPLSSPVLPLAFLWLHRCHIRLPLLLEFHRPLLVEHHRIRVSVSTPTLWSPSTKQEVSTSCKRLKLNIPRSMNLLTETENRTRLLWPPYCKYRAARRKATSGMAKQGACQHFNLLLLGEEGLLCKDSAVTVRYFNFKR